MSLSPLPLAGQAAFVTGGGTGIGLACARRLLLDGAAVTIGGRREDRLLLAVEALQAEAPAGVVVQHAVCDVTDEAQIEAAVARAAQPVGGLDIAVASAGRGSVSPIIATPVEEIEGILATNVTGVLLTIKHAARAMIPRGGGAITVISSLAATTTHPHMGPYNASKAAADMLMRTAADELGQAGIRVNSVQPGFVDTEIVEIPMSDPAVLQSYLAAMPVSRVGQPEDIAAAVRFLSGPESSWISGVCVPVDGGHHLRGGPDYSSLARLLYGDDLVDARLPT